jgi:DNA repair photolyase
MPLNPAKGNMYPFVTHTWNTIKGQCPHNCSYCYMKRFGEQKPIRFDEKELKTDLGEDNFIFVGSSCDMWAWGIDWDWINRTLIHCCTFKNRYLFQSKNPTRFMAFYELFPPNTIFGTTIETNRGEYIKKIAPNAPTIISRFYGISDINYKYGWPTIVTIEPIMDFDLDEMVDIISGLRPEWVNIGANTNFKVQLPEPKPEKIRELISKLEQITEVKVKQNLSRLGYEI